MAFGMGTFSAIGGAVSDIFGGQERADGMRIQATGTRLKAYGDRMAADNYDLSAGFADTNQEFTRQATAIKLAQQDRQLYLGLGTTQADVGAAGFTMGGSALDLMRAGAQQGALTRQVLGQQGLISEEGYKVQGTSYRNMATAARYAADIEDQMASEQDSLANKIESDSMITGGIKAISGIASIFL